MSNIDKCFCCRSEEGYGFPLLDVWQITVHCFLGQYLTKTFPRQNRKKFPWVIFACVLYHVHALFALLSSQMNVRCVSKP